MTRFPETYYGDPDDAADEFWHGQRKSRFQLREERQERRADDAHDEEPFEVD